MANGGSKTQRIDITDSYNPSVQGRAAAKGTIFRYIPSAGSPQVFIKNDDGFSTNWVALGGGGGGANQALSNLTSPTAVNQSLIPGSDLTLNLGSLIRRYNIHYVAEVRGDSEPSIFVTDRELYDANGLLSVNWDSRELLNTSELPVMNWSAATLTGASNGFVWTLLNNTTGASGWAAPSGGTPVGTFNAIAFYDGAGNLSVGQSNFRTNPALQGALMIGTEVSGGLLTASVDGTFAQGGALQKGRITSSAIGSFAGGYVIHPNSDPNANSTITAAANGAFAYGSLGFDGSGGAGLVASGVGSTAHGYATGAGQLQAVGIGAFATGYAFGGNVLATGNASMAHGYGVDGGGVESFGVGSHSHGFGITNSFVGSGGDGSMAFGIAQGVPFSPAAVLNAGGNGSLAFGTAVGTAAAINAFSEASKVFGAATSGGKIRTNGISAQASGAASTAGVIQATGISAHAFGSSTNGGLISSTGIGSLAFGSSIGGGITSIVASGNGSLAFGAPVSGSIQASGVGSFALGDDVSVSANFAQCFGVGLISSSFASMYIGRYANQTVDSPGAWVATDPLFVAGNGVGVGSRANAYKLDKDGKITTSAAQVHSACRSVSADTTLSARTDRTLFVDTATAVSAVAVTMPPGEDGLEFFVKDSGGNAIVNNITFTPNGADVMESGSTITSVRGCRHFQFFGGVWYDMNRS